EAGLLPDRRLWSGEGHRSSEDEDLSDSTAITAASTLARSSSSTRSIGSTTSD
ncbi:unnamed protein product, partial [Ascophyllum nodosum]